MTLSILGYPSDFDSMEPANEQLRAVRDELWHQNERALLLGLEPVEADAKDQRRVLALISFR